MVKIEKYMQICLAHSFSRAEHARIYTSSISIAKPENEGRKENET
jgi:hypothetical protein